LGLSGHQGFDIGLGDTVLKAGERLGPAEIALLATIGIIDVKVHKLRSCACKWILVP
jgi:molybdopterin biosynthesis enzyme